MVQADVYCYFINGSIVGRITISLSVENVAARLIVPARIPFVGNALVKFTRVSTGPSDNNFGRLL